MSRKTAKDYYMKNKARLTTQCNKSLHLSKDILLERFDELELEEVFNQMRNEFENYIYRR